MSDNSFYCIIWALIFLTLFLGLHEIFMHIQIGDLMEQVNKCKAPK